MISFKTQNSVQDMVEVLKIHGTLSENEINTKAFGYRTKFIYFATKPTQIECSAALDNEWANESM